MPRFVPQIKTAIGEWRLKCHPPSPRPFLWGKSRTLQHPNCLPVRSSRRTRRTFFMGTPQRVRGWRYLGLGFGPRFMRGVSRAAAVVHP